MRVEPYSIDSVLHVTKRGARGMRITRSADDRDRFPKLLYYLNSKRQPDHWEREIQESELLEWPSHWGERVPLVRILGWTLMPNHFHLLLQEINGGGVSKFMQRVCGSMSRHFNVKYEETGSLFQGAFKSRTINDDRYLRYCASYVMAKNPLELYPRGLAGAMRTFDDAWKWAMKYPYSSLPIYGNNQKSVIVDESNILTSMFSTESEFKTASYDMLRTHIEGSDIEYDSV